MEQPSNNCRVTFPYRFAPRSLCDWRLCGDGVDKLRPGSSHNPSAWNHAAVLHERPPQGNFLKFCREKSFIRFWERTNEGGMIRRFASPRPHHFFVTAKQVVFDFHSPSKKRVIRQHLKGRLAQWNELWLNGKMKEIWGRVFQWFTVQKGISDCSEWF